MQDAERHPVPLREQASITRRLDGDRHARAASMSVEPARFLVERLGPRPGGRSAASLWDDAAGRAAQHHAAFEVAESTLLGRQPRPLDDDAYTTSHRAAVAAISRLDRALGRQPEIEPPHRSLGISR